MRLLEPWLKEQLFGKQAPEAEPDDDAGGPGDVETGSTEPGETETGEPSEGEVASVPASDAATEAAPESETDAAPRDPEAPSGVGTAATDAFQAPEPLPEAPVDPGPPPLRFAVIAGYSAAETIATVGPVVDEIGSLLDRPVELLPMTSYTAMIDAQVERRIDGGFYTASAFVLAESRCRCLEPIVAPRAFDGTLAYHAVIVARTGSDIASILDLEGKTIAVGADDSVGARRVQLAGLMSAGIDPASFFRGVVEMRSANEGVRLLMERAVDAAFAWSSLTGDVESGYTRGTLAQLVTEGEVAMHDLAIVWRSPPITHGPFAVLGSMSEEDKDKIGSFLLTLEGTHPIAYDVLNPFYGGGYAPVDLEDYAGLERLATQDVEALSLPTRAAAEIARPERTEEPAAD
jgi:phosphonate transport system substrate-binding protein